jgi:hypothetical protein
LAIISKYKANWIQPVDRRQRNGLLEVLKKVAAFMDLQIGVRHLQKRPEADTKWPNFRTATLLEAADG